MIDATTALVIECDNGEGTPDKACKDGADTKTCFSHLPTFKRVYKVEFSPETAGKPMRKIAYIDLLNVQDPNKVARKPLTNGFLQFPFSASRDPNKQDDNELVLLNVTQLLQAK